MKQLVRNAQGWTLPEVLTAVFLASVLMGIAVPLFADERFKAFNSAAESDVRNLKTAEEILMGDYRVYGATEEGTLPGSGGVKGTGAELMGPLEAAKAAGDTGNLRKRPGSAAATAPAIPGAFITGKDSEGVVRGIGISVGAGVFLQADISPKGDANAIYGRHQQGNQAYSSESDTTGIFVCENDAWVNQKGILAKRAAEVSAMYDDLAEEDCGGKQIAKWKYL